MSCVNYYLVFESSVDSHGLIMVLKGKGMGGSKNVYTRIIYRVYNRLH